jgi:hypothetical protein
MSRVARCGCPQGGALEHEARGVLRGRQPKEQSLVGVTRENELKVFASFTRQA